jgi:PAS domain S-box-containing protein
VNAALRVLLIEDSPDDARLLEHTLQQGGFDPSIVRVEDAAGLRAALRDGPWDVLIADHALPHFSAPAALELLQHSGLDIPLILLSGKMGEEAAMALMRAGATDFIPKDNLSRLIPAIRREVRDARSRADRRRTGDQLAMQAHLLRAVAQAVVATDLDGRVTYWNDAAERIYGWTATEAMGRDLSELMGTGAAALPSADIRARLRSGQVWSGERVVIRRDGAPVPLLTNASPAYDEEGHVASLVWVSSDITEIKQRERHQSALAAVSAALREALDQPSMRAVVVEQLLERLPAGGAMLIGLDRKVELAGGDWAPLTGQKLPADPGPLGEVLAEGKALAAAELAGAPQLQWLAVAEATRSLAAVALRAHGQMRGILAIGSPAPIGPDELRLLEGIADAAASALYSVAMFDQVQRRVEQLRTVSLLGQGLAESLDLRTIYSTLYQAVVGLWPDSTGVTISRYEERRSLIQYVFVMSDGEAQDPDRLPSFPFSPHGGGPQSRAISQRQAQIIDDLDEMTRGRPAALMGSNDRAPLSGLYVPMLAKGEVVGVVAVQTYTRGRFTPDDADLLALVANTAAVAVSNAQLFEEANRRMGHLEALRDIDVAISSSLDMQVTLTVFLSQVVQQLGVDAAQVLLLSPASQMLEHAGSRGFRRQTTRLRQSVRLGEGLAGRAALERVTHSAPGAFASQMAPAGDPRAGLLAAERFVAHYAVPLVAKGQVKGVLEVFHRAPLDPTPEWLDFLETLAGHAAIAVDQAELFNHLQQSNAELSLAYDATIEGWSAALDLRDKVTEGHTQRVTHISLRLAAAAGLPDSALMHARRGALLHDIGKIAIPDSILNKPGPLDDEEWAVMRLHPVYAHDLLAPIAFLRPAIDIPYCHHEKWDGSGYPRRLTGAEIPLAARVFSVVDVWDALGSDRPWRAAWPQDQVQAYLREQSGVSFDPLLVELFLGMAEED